MGRKQMRKEETSVKKSRNRKGTVKWKKRERERK